MYPKKQLAQLVIAACHHYKIDRVVISPGSRNAPLTIGFSNSECINAMSVVDERCAAFFALGMAQQTRKPVALVCTSGSALLNYYPAIAEAFYSNIPLVVISADRPSHLINIGDGQTINQENVFANHIAFSANLRESNTIQINKELISNAIQKSILEQLPVHINVPFDEPLYEKVHQLEVFEFPEEQLPDDSEYEWSEKDIHIWNSAKRKLIIIGVLSPSKDLELVLRNLKSNDESVLILSEATSNLNDSPFINVIDKLITPFSVQDIEEFRPDLLITLGGFVVSKRIKQLLRSFKLTNHWHIDSYTKLDTFFSLTKYVKETASVAIRNLIDQQSVYKSVEKSNSYGEYFHKIKTIRDVNHHIFLQNAPFSDLKVVGRVLGSIPEACQLQVSNSSMIRYVQLFDLKKSLRVFCNRGASGIDGSTSTAIGASVVFNKQTVLLTGDVSFFYDSNALWNSYIPSSFRIILVNNDGGGIFKIIPGPKSSSALPFFETKHGLTASHLAVMYGFEYVSVSNDAELDNILENFYQESDKPKILEIFTPSQTNDVVLQDYFNSL